MNTELRVTAVLESGAKASNDAANFVMCRPDVITNGDFAVGTGWTLGANWAISGGNCTHSTGATAEFSQADIIKQHGAEYLLTFTTSTFTAGTLIADVGGTNGTSRSTAATFTEVITAGTADRSLAFTPNSASDAVVDDVILRPIVYATRVIIANSGLISYHVVCNSAIGTESASATVFETVVGANSTYDLSEGGTRVIRTVSVFANGTLAAAGDMQVWGFA